MKFNKYMKSKNILNKIKQKNDGTTATKKAVAVVAAQYIRYSPERINKTKTYVFMTFYRNAKNFYNF